MLGALANRYARALVDVVTKPGAPVSPDSVLAELTAFVDAFRSMPALRNVLTSPAVAPVKKKAIISEIGERLGLSRTTRNFLFVVVDHRRMEVLPQMLAALQQQLDERMGIARVHVTAAQTLGAEQQDSLAGRLSEVTGKQVRMEHSIDPALLGGLVTRVGSTIYDGSVKGQLRAIQRRLSEE